MDEAYLAPQPADPTPPPRPGPFWTWQRWLWLMLAVLFFAGSGVGLGVFLTYLGEVPLVSDLKAYKPSLSTKVYDVRGRLIVELFSEQRTLISLDDVPENLQHAFLAIEDQNFYQHIGVDFGGVIRSFFVNLSSGSFRQGFSTITMQLARNMFLTRKKNIPRKIKEIIVAFQIERTYKKPEILEMYLNQIYFGAGAHGIESAARTYFGKHVHELDLPECALLAGLPRAPNAYNPYRNMEKALARRNLVLSQMQRLGYIGIQAAVDAKLTPIHLSSGEVSEAPYFVEYVRQQLEARYGSSAIYQAGLRVHTSLDLDLQRLAQAAMDEGIVEAETFIQERMETLAGQEPEIVQCALILIEPGSGEIRALIGGRDFQTSKFNRAVQAQRQPGSAFKPFIYATAFANGFTQADIILDTPVVFNDDKGAVWKPENFSNKFRGPTTLRTALTKSRNVVTVKLLDKIGAQHVIDLAQTLGIRSPLKPFLTLALGASEVNLLELVSAFSTFPNRGVHVEPISILRVEGNNGEVMEDNTPFQEEVMDKTTAAIMTNLLENVVNRGTGYTARRLGFKHPAGGKTGTTNDYSDAWFLGFTSEYAAGVWVGLDSHRSMGKNVTGGKVACPIWTKLMLRIYEERVPKKFVYPETVEKVKFCNVSGLLPNPACARHVVTGTFAIGTAPTLPCDVHRGSGSLDLEHSYDLNVSPDLVDLRSNTGTGQADGAAPAHPGSLSTPPPADGDRPPMF